MTLFTGVPHQGFHRDIEHFRMKIDRKYRYILWYTSMHPVRKFGFVLWNISAMMLCHEKLNLVRSVRAAGNTDHILACFSKSPSGLWLWKPSCVGNTVGKIISSLPYTGITYSVVTGYTGITYSVVTGHYHNLDNPVPDPLPWSRRPALSWWRGWRFILVTSRVPGRRRRIVTSEPR